jgi:hypothetical protein
MEFVKTVVVSQERASLSYCTASETPAANDNSPKVQCFILVQEYIWRKKKLGKYQAWGVQLHPQSNAES